MTLAIASRSRSEGEALLRRALRCAVDGTGLAIAAATEHLRSALYGTALFGTGHGLASTVHTTRLLNDPRRMLDLMMDVDVGTRTENRSNLDHDTARSALEALERVGDAVDIGHGQWLGTPTRLLAIEGASDFLLTGALPHGVAESFLSSRIFCAGASRLAEAPAGGRTELEDLVVPMDAWFGNQTSLASWTEAVLSEHTALMKDEGSGSADQLELYAPDILRSQRRPGRWIAANQIGTPVGEIRLCRPRMSARRYNLPHFLGTFEFRHGSLILRRCAPIAHGLTLRLRFGLDRELGTPRRFAVTIADPIFVVDKPPKLPEPESRIYALGWEVRDSAGARLAFQIRALPFVLHVLQSLSIAPTLEREANT